MRGWKVTSCLDLTRSEIGALSAPSHRGQGGGIWVAIRNATRMNAHFLSILGVPIPMESVIGETDF